MSDRRHSNAAWMLASDPAAYEALMRGHAVPSHRLQTDMLDQLGVTNGSVTLDDELALKVELLGPSAGQPSNVGTSLLEPPKAVSPKDFRLVDVTAPEVMQLPNAAEDDLLLGPFVRRDGRTIIVGDDEADTAE